jgi:hypothetical protein
MTTALVLLLVLSAVLAGFVRIVATDADARAMLFDPRPWGHLIKRTHRS